MERKIGNALLTETGVFVHGCNAQGVIGSGITKEIKKKFPEAFAAYTKAHSQGELTLGSSTIVEVRPIFWIVNGVTQKFYGRTPGRVYIDYDAIRLVFRQTGRLVKEKNVPLLFPLIGCGLGDGNWAIVAKIIEEVPSSVQKVLYTLDTTPLPTNIVSTKIASPTKISRPRFS